MAAIYTDTEGITTPVWFRSHGMTDGVEYVTVIDDGGNPIEYATPIADAIAYYGDPDGEGDQ